MRNIWGAEDIDTGASRSASRFTRSTSTRGGGGSGPTSTRASPLREPSLRELLTPASRGAEESSVESRLLRAEVAAQNRLISTLKQELQRAEAAEREWRERYEDAVAAPMAERDSASALTLHDEAAAQALHDAAHELREKDAALRACERLLQRRETELSELSEDVAKLEEEMRAVRQVHGALRGRWDHRHHHREVRADDGTRRPPAEAAMPDTVGAATAAAATPPREAAHLTTAALLDLTSPQRRVEEELALLAEQLRLKQRQVAELEEEVVRLMHERSVARGDAGAAREQAGELQQTVQRMQQAELEHRAHLALQQQALEERSEIADLVKREFSTLTHLLAEQMNRAAALQGEVDQLTRSAEDAATLQHELERERRMCRAARDVLKLREQEIATLMDSVLALRGRSGSPQHTTAAGMSAQLATTTPLRAAREASQNLSLWHSYSAARSSSSSNHSSNEVGAFAAPAQSQPPAHHADALRLENGALRAELAALRGVRRV